MGVRYVVSQTRRVVTGDGMWYGSVGCLTCEITWRELASNSTERVQMKLTRVTDNSLRTQESLASLPTIHSKPPKLVLPPDKTRLNRRWISEYPATGKRENLQCQKP